MIFFLIKCLYQILASNCVTGAAEEPVVLFLQCNSIYRKRKLEL